MMLDTKNGPFLCRLPLKGATQHALSSAGPKKKYWHGGKTYVISKIVLKKERSNKLISENRQPVVVSQLPDVFVGMQGHSLADSKVGIGTVHQERLIFPKLNKMMRALTTLHNQCLSPKNVINSS